MQCSSEEVKRRSHEDKAVEKQRSGEGNEAEDRQ